MGPGKAKVCFRQVVQVWLKHEMGPGKAKVCFSAGVRAWLKHEMGPGKAKVCFSAGVQVWLKHEMWPGRAKVCFKAGDAAVEGSAWSFGQRPKTGRSGRLTSNSSFYGPSARNVLEQVPYLPQLMPRAIAGKGRSPCRVDNCRALQGRFRVNAATNRALSTQNLAALTTAGLSRADFVSTRQRIGLYRPKTLPR